MSKSELNEKINSCMDSEYFQALINCGDRIGALCFATGYLSDDAELFSLLSAIVNANQAI